MRQAWRHCAEGIRAFVADRRGTVITFMADLVISIDLSGSMGQPM
jgi:hypothetical protein